MTNCRNRGRNPTRRFSAHIRDFTTNSTGGFQLESIGGGALPPLPDGHMLWTVVNCNIDPLRPRVRCRRPVRGIELLTPGGRREALPFHVCGTAVVPEVELALHEPGIFRFND